MNIKARLRALEEKLKPADAIIVQMPHGAIVSIQPRAGEKILDCIKRLIENPLSAESRHLAHAVEYLRPDGHLLEVIAPMRQHSSAKSTSTMTLNLVTTRYG